MLRYIFRHFRLERGRIGVLGERNLLQLKVSGNTAKELEAFGDKYIYVMQSIPVEDMPKEQTLFNHLLDELEHNSLMAPKVLEAGEAALGSHRRTTQWLWQKVDLLIQLEQQKKNRADFQKQLQLKPGAGFGGSGQPFGELIPANPAPSDPIKPGKEKKPKKTKEEKTEEKQPTPRGNPTPAAPAPKAKAKPKGAPKGPPAKSAPTTPGVRRRRRLPT